MSDCPNCGKDVPDGDRLCPHCGFDTGEAQAEDVQGLREAGEIHPGRIGADGAEEFSGSRAEDDPEETLPGEGPVDPRETDAGL